MKGAYDPYYIRLRVRPISPAKSLVLYLWTMLWLGAVMFFWMWAITPLRQILPDTH